MRGQVVNLAQHVGGEAWAHFLDVVEGELELGDALLHLAFPVRPQELCQHWSHHAWHAVEGVAGHLHGRRRSATWSAQPRRTAGTLPREPASHPAEYAGELQWCQGLRGGEVGGAWKSGARRRFHRGRGAAFPGPQSGRGFVHARGAVSPERGGGGRAVCAWHGGLRHPLRRAWLQRPVPIACAIAAAAAAQPALRGSDSDSERRG
mmetsp:Transcript_3630/g.10276  ORF Transcript_3630/g.10276 Transcript_3630/m.10276 type:complete len:206 (-) Transcript_3630:136-753(-)